MAPVPRLRLLALAAGLLPLGCSSPAPTHHCVVTPYELVVCSETRPAPAASSAEQQH